jgi:competence protein ComEC
VDTVSLWIHTHYDADHVGGATRVLAGADAVWNTADDPIVLAAWDRGPEAIPSTEAASLYFAAFADVRVAATTGDRFEAPGLSVEILGTGPPSADDENERGLSLCLTAGSKRVLIPGDLPADAMVGVAARCSPADILWASHHGAKEGTSRELLELVDPVAVVVSAGRENPHCHPSSETLALLGDRPVWITHAAGIAPDGPCGGLASAMGPSHAVFAADIWIPTS